MKTELRIVEITPNSFTDGPGVRTVVFFKGCPLRCAWCHNPESRSFAPETMFYPERCTGCGMCREVCPNGTADLADGCAVCGTCAAYCLAGARRFVGTLTDTEAVLADILRYSFLCGKDGGVTFSGGECTAQPRALLELLRACRESGIHTAVDTCGYCPTEVLDSVLPYTDLFLWDLKLSDGAAHRAYTGVDNSLILKNLGHIAEAGAKILFRIPLIGGVNDSEEELNGMKKIVSSVPSVGVEVLPFHSLGNAKYRALGKTVPDFGTPDEETAALFRKVLSSAVRKIE